ncbi:hypothetical protein [Neptunomonas japonica]|uniref:Uncharacterized protein n=1 Tax=Neptunomonas japonica JAMM 1380 TaxID=1441457 RepID=A0A7R6PUQ8_9GAMM|nr:hypothetical protein [Neptunomonas japonica]BBB29878.1 conserved hypothetical protein [Neptunomonas japonica JAMM 1380]
MDSTKEAAPSPHACSLACSLDWGVSSIINTFIQSFIRTGLTLIGLAMLIFSIVDRYEYGEGFADLSRFELIYSVMVFLLIMRVKAVIKKSTVPWWKAIFLPLILIGQFTAILLLIIGFFAFADLINKTDIIMNALLFEETLIELVMYATVILGLYCGVPRFRTLIPEEARRASPDEMNSTDEPRSSDPETSADQPAT